MRLQILERGHRLRARLLVRLVRGLTRQYRDAVAQMALCRPQFFGQPMFAFGSEVLRGPSYWTPAECEFLAVFTSRLNGARPAFASTPRRPGSSPAAAWTPATRARCCRCWRR